MTFWKRQKHGESKKIIGCQGVGRGRGSETILQFTIMVDMSAYVCQNPHDIKYQREP